MSDCKTERHEIALDLASYNVVDARLEDFREIMEKYTLISFSPTRMRQGHLQALILNQPWNRYQNPVK
jgi:hypothetical protein